VHIAHDRSTDKRQTDVKNWLLWSMMADRPQDEPEEDGPAFIGEWPPPRSRQLTTQIIHRREKINDGQTELDDSPQPKSKRHRAIIDLDEGEECSRYQATEAQGSGSGTQGSE
jgi:hypothetical protein